MIPQDITQRISQYSKSSSADWKASKYTLLAQLYFFFNQLFLPKGLLYTHLLSPLLFYNILRKGYKTWFMPFIGVLLIFNICHLYLGVDLKSFFISNVLFICTYFTVISFYHFAGNYDGLGRIFRQVLLLNALLVLIALPFLFAPRHLQEWFWYFNKLTPGLSDFPRLALFTYEASYYALIMVPVFYYYIFKFLFGKILYNKWTTLLLVSVPLLLSLSFGVLGASAITALLMCIIFFRKLLVYRRALIVATITLLILAGAMLVLYIYFPKNPFFFRLENIWTGTDTSAKGRTTESFGMAWKIAETRSIYTGVGLGQVKHIVVEIVRRHYNYWGEFSRYDIPNAMAETLAIFGLAGVSLRLFLEIWLFFRTRVFDNYYRLALFIFVFVYQFTGSFITNVAEYSIWILAFAQVFPVFDRSPATSPPKIR